MAQKKNTPISLSNAADPAQIDKEVPVKTKRQRKVRQPAEMLVLEQRMMFDGAAASTGELILESSTASSDSSQNNSTPAAPSESEVFVPQSVAAPSSNPQTEEDEASGTQAPQNSVETSESNSGNDLSALPETAETAETAETELNRPGFRGGQLV